MSELPGASDAAIKLRLWRGATRYYKHLIAIGANPAFTAEGAANWVGGFGIYRMFYEEVVKPCLDENGVVGQDRAFYVALAYRLFKTLHGSSTMSLVSPADFARFVEDVVREYVNLVDKFDVEVGTCLSARLGVPRAEAAGAGGVPG